MDPTQLWQTLLDQLQHDLPRASFETWLRDTRVKSREADTLRIVARDVYARDWLQSRMSGEIGKRLTALSGEALQVAFVVEQEYLEDEEQECFSADVVDDTEYQSEVRPDRVVLFDGYALRYLEHGEATPKELSIWLGMRQAVYVSWKKGDGTIRNIPYWEALRFARMSRSSFFREVSGRETLAGGLIELVPTPAAPLQDRRLDNANRYSIHMTPRLTRRDCAVLQDLLHREVCLAASREEAQQIALRTVQSLIAGEPGEYLEQVPQVVVAADQPRSTLEVLRRVLDLPELPAELQKLAGKLTDRIVRGFGRVLVTHYFLQVAAHRHKLTHPQLWAIIALRDRCWYDHETRSQKEFALVRGGLSEVGAWVGVDRKTVRRWLQDPSFAAFVQVTDAAALNLDAAWVGLRTVFQVRQEEPLEDDGGWDKMRHDAGQSEYRPGTKCDSVRDKVSTDVGQNAPLLNNLNQPQVSLTNPQESPPAFARVGRQGFWDLDFLLENNRAQPGSRKNLFASNKSWGRDLKTLSAGFVSWVLYAYSPEGSGVRDPIGLALQHLTRHAHAGAGGSFDRLAKLRPHELRALFDADMTGVALDDSLEADLFRANFSALLPEHKRELYERLFGFPEPVHAAVNDK